MHLTKDDKKMEALLQFQHDIRTPLNILLGFIQILSYDNTLTNNERDLYMNIIKEETTELLKNMDSILNSYIKD